MKIRTAKISDLELLRQDRHISENELKNSISCKRVYIAEENGVFAGWLRYNLFWDNTPFMNMLYVLDGYRGSGFGKALVSRWENDMAALGYNTVMTSTASNEYAQHFYNKLGYTAAGGFMPPDEPLEIILIKSI